MPTPYSPVLFIILDGFGICPDFSDSAINQHTAPFWHYLLQQYSYTQLYASGVYVGLPANYPGNSQVGHLALGTGKIIKQPITIINELINTGHFYTHSLLQKHFDQLATENKSLHILGIASDGTVHGNIEHIIAYIKVAKKYSLSIFLHLILDGRDVLPTSAGQYIKQLDPYLDAQCSIATLHGRFFAMDRDNNMDRIAKSLHILFTNKSTHPLSWEKALADSYQKGITDEFFEPCRLQQEGIIKKGDGIICTNTRPERIIQLINALNAQQNRPVWIISPITYGNGVNTIPLLAFDPIDDTLKAAWNNQNKKIFTVAETEKWAHVTYFFDGMQDRQYLYETRVHVSSLKEKTYATHPEMSAPVITKIVLDAIDTKEYDLFIINYANADMVAHAGNPAATAQAITCLDDQLKLLYKKVHSVQGTIMITADHGNAECTLDKDTHRLKKAHTSNKVPFVLISHNQCANKQVHKLKGLADIKDFMCTYFLLH